MLASPFFKWAENELKMAKEKFKSLQEWFEKDAQTKLMEHAVFESHSEEVSFLHKKPILKKFSLGPLPVKGSVGPRSTMGRNIF